MGDWTRDEYRSRLGYRRRQPTATHRAAHRATSRPPKGLPTSWDWRDHNAVNPVQNQGQCGSCYAFTAGDAVSGLWAIKTGLLFPVSVQEILDCSGSEGNQGCNGGMPDWCYQWVVANGGVTDWNEYQYTSQDGTCASANVTNVATIKGFADIATGDENALMTAVSKTVVSGAIDASSQVYQFYTSGVLDDPSCGTDIDHGQTIIGWGTDAATKKDYWLLRNMWGTNWGDQGYVRVVRGKNMCGVASDASYPTD